VGDPKRATLAFATERVRNLWERARRERSTPGGVGWAVGVGAFVAFTPFVGFHLGIAFALATLFKLSRLWAMLGSRLSAAPILVGMAFVQIQAAHRLRTGAWVPLTIRIVMNRAPELLLDWSLGCILVGAPVAAIAGWAAYRIASRWSTTSTVTRGTPETPR
jgi:uncharacterized protein (DUF2062 family)